MPGHKICQGENHFSQQILWDHPLDVCVCDIPSIRSHNRHLHSDVISATLHQDDLFIFTQAIIYNQYSPYLLVILDD